MHFPFTHPTTNHSEEPPAVVTHEPESLSMEGSEFLFDGLRMDELAGIRTEEIVAAGSPGQLLL